MCLSRKPGAASPTGVSGHFQQVVWGTTNRVGCGYIFNEHPTKNIAIVSCKYAAVPVNGKPEKKMGGPIYIEGKPCSKCKEYGYNGCEDGLCVP